MGQRHPLANDERGIAFELPDMARRWRVQRMTGRRGKQEVIYDNGVPLEIDITATASELRAAVERVTGNGGGRFRLEAVDERGASVAKVAYTALTDSRGAISEEHTDEEHGELAGGEVSRVLRVLKETIEEVRKRDADTTQALRSRDEQSLDQLRRSNQELTQALAGAVQALTRGYAPVVPSPEYEEQQQPAAAPIDEKTVVQQVTELLQAAPQAIPVIAQLLQAIRQQAAAPPPPAGDGNKPNGDGENK